MEKKELTTEEWKEEKKRKKAQMIAMQRLPYEVKVKRAELRAIEFVERLDDLDMNAHVSVGGLDSIVLLLFLRKIGIDIPAISVSALEDKSIQKVHRELGIESVKPGKSKVQILNDVGFPVISKKIAGRIDTLQHPTDLSIHSTTQVETAISYNIIQDFLLISNKLTIISYIYHQFLLHILSITIPFCIFFWCESPWNFMFA